MAASKNTVNKAKNDKTAAPAKAEPAPVKAAAPAPVKAAAKVKASAPPTDLAIRTRAYEIYVSEGCQDGRDMEYWLRAETELRQSAN